MATGSKGTGIVLSLTCNLSGYLLSNPVYPCVPQLETREYMNVKSLATRSGMGDIVSERDWSMQSVSVGS